MQNELTNLLPEDRQRVLRRRYFLRLGVVAIIFLILLTCIAAVVLIPTYVFLTESAHAKEMHLASIESSASFNIESTLSNDSKILKMSAETPSVSATIRSALAVSRPGITLSGFSYTPASDKNSGTLTISGIAATRDALRNYQLALQNAPFATSADVPIYVYAKDTNIDFTITATLAPPISQP